MLSNVYGMLYESMYKIGMSQNEGGRLFRARGTAAERHSLLPVPAAVFPRQI